MALIRDTDDTPTDGRTLGKPLAAGAAAGLLAGIPMLALLMTAGALADEPTAKPGVESSVVTMPNAVTQFVFSAGPDQFYADYRWLTYPGLAIHFIVAVGLGAIGAGLIAAVVGRRAPVVPSLIAGIVYGVILQALVLFAFVSGIQDVDTVQTSVPIWAWWAAHVLYGGLLGLIAAPMMRSADRHADARATAA